MRCLGIDYGTKRIGLSFGDELGVATPLPALVEGTPEERLDALAKQAKDRRITNLVIGYPYNMDGTVGFKAKEVDEFIAALLLKIELPVHRIDERLTSHEVERHVKKGRDDAFRRSGKVDSAAATLILQDFLSQRIPAPEFDPFEDEEELD